MRSNCGSPGLSASISFAIGSANSGLFIAPSIPRSVWRTVGSTRASRTIVCTARVVSPFAVYASTALRIARVFVESVRMICSATRSTESGPLLPYW